MDRQPSSAFGVGRFLLVAGFLIVGTAWYVQGGATADQSGRQAANQQSATFPKPVIDTHELMELFNEPIYHALQEAFKNKAGGEKRWETIQSEARRAAEVANLIAIREDAAEYPKWKAMAHDAQKVAQALEQAAGMKNEMKARQAYVRLIEQCNDCHRSTEPDHAPTLKPFGSD